MRRKAKRADDIEGVITHSASQDIPLPQVSAAVEVERMLKQAREDMHKRCVLTEMGRANPGAAKARRELNNWTLGKAECVVKDVWFPNGHKSAHGKCDAAAVRKRNRLKRDGR